MKSAAGSLHPIFSPRSKVSLSSQKFSLGHVQRNLNRSWHKGWLEPIAMSLMHMTAQTSISALSYPWNNAIKSFPRSARGGGKSNSFNSTLQILMLPDHPVSPIYLSKTKQRLDRILLEWFMNCDFLLAVLLPVFVEYTKAETEKKFEFFKSI